MVIYDSHVHLKHGDAAATEYSAEAIIQTMDAAGIEKSVVFAMSTTTRRSVEIAREAVAKSPERLIPYVYALPNYERSVLPEIERAISELGFRGIKVHAGECRLTDYISDPVFELAGKLGVPCLVDFAGDFAAARRIASKFVRTRLIIAHLGQYLCTSAERLDRFIEIAEACGNVFLDISGVALPWKVEDAVRRVGSDRVVFGTDGPHPAPDTASFARLEVSKVNMLNLSPAEKEDVFAGTLSTLLRLG
jgi:hypothetical protein